MTTWLIPLRGSTEVIDLDPPAGDLAVTGDKPATSFESQACEQHLAPTKHVSPSGSSYRSYGGTIAGIQKRLRTSALAEAPRPKKVGRAVTELGLPAQKH